VFLWFKTPRKQKENPRENQKKRKPPPLRYDYFDWKLELGSG
jgi:hypothetical protein